MSKLNWERGKSNCAYSTMLLLCIAIQSSLTNCRLIINCICLLWFHSVWILNFNDHWKLSTLLAEIISFPSFLFLWWVGIPQVIYIIQSYALNGSHEKCFLQFKERVLCLQENNRFLNLPVTRNILTSRHLDVNFKLLALPNIFSLSQWCQIRVTLLNK